MGSVLLNPSYSFSLTNTDLINSQVADSPATAGTSPSSPRQGVVNVENLLGSIDIPLAGVSNGDYLYFRTSGNVCQAVVGGFNWSSGGATTVAAGSNGVSLATLAGGTALSLASTAQFATTGGQIIVAASGGSAIMTYTGVSGATLTGLALITRQSSWTVATGGAVTSPGIAVTATTGSSGTTINTTTNPQTALGLTGASAGYVEVFHNITDTTSTGSAINLSVMNGGYTLIVSANPITAGFASAGYIRVVTSSGTAVVSYTGLTSTGFVGCLALQPTFSGSALTVANGATISQQTTYVFAFTGTTSSTFTGCTPTSYGQQVSYGGTVTNTTPANTSVVSSADQIVVFYNNPSALVTAAQVNVQCGWESSSGSPSGTLLSILQQSGSDTLFYNNANPYFPANASVYPASQIPNLTSSAVEPWGIGLTALVNGPISPIAPFSPTPANLQQLSVFLQLTGVTNQETLRVASVQLQLTVVTQAPTVTPSLPGGTTNAQTQPTISWAYGDPDGLPQESYRIVVFAENDVANSNFDINAPTPGTGGPWFVGDILATEFWSLNGTQVNLANSPYPSGGISGNWLLPVYDTGDVFSTATSAVIGNLSGAVGTVTPAQQIALEDNGFNTGRCYNGYLIPGQKYRAFVFVQAQGLTGIYPVLTNSGGGGLDQGIDFTVNPEPVLMPSVTFPSSPSNPTVAFNSSVGYIGEIAVRARYNLLSQVDADLLSNGVPALGGWTLDTNNSAGTGTTASILASNFLTTYAEASLFVTPYGTSSTKVAVISGKQACQPGLVVTAQGRIEASNSGGLTAAVTPYLVFYNAAGAILDTIFGGASGTSSLPAASSIQPLVAAVQCKTPQGCASVAFGMLMTETIGTASNVYWTLSQFNININCINHSMDPGLASGTNAQVEVAAGSPVTVGWFAQSNNGSGTTNPSCTQDTGPSNPGGNNAFDVYNASATALSAIVQTESPHMWGTEAATWLAAVDAKLVPSTFASTFGAPPANTPTNLKLGPFARGTGTAPSITSQAASVTVALTTAWQRFAVSFTSSNTTPGVLGLGVATAQGTFEYHATNFQLEKVWTLTDGTFEAFASGTAVPLSTALGQYTSPTAANPGQWWQLLNALPTGGTAAVSNATPFAGTNCMLLNATTSILGPVAIEQLFTVSGLTSITPAAQWKLTTVSALGATAYIEFFDNAGTLLDITPGPGAVTQTQAVIANAGGTAAYAAIGGVAIAVPTNAAFAHLVFQLNQVPTVAGALQIDNVTMGLTGTLACSTPWIDGGWQQGGLASGATVQLQRSPDDSTFTTVRSNGGAAVPYAAPVSASEVDYTDYEYPGGTYATPQTIYYAAQLINGTFSSPVNEQVLTAASSFSPSQWVLIDPLFGGNLTLQVKGKVDFQRDENQSVLMPMSRGRKVVIGDAYTFGPTITLPLQTLNYTDYVALDAMLGKTYALVLRSPEGEMWYVRKTKYQSTRTWQGSYTRPMRTYQITLENVDAIA